MRLRNMPDVWNGCHRSFVEGEDLLLFVAFTTYPASASASSQPYARLYVGLGWREIISAVQKLHGALLPFQLGADQRPSNNVTGYMSAL